ncbi:MAG: hypothetical protein COX81_03685 [Candidatus Magasanikbacteria bacterium CG_4_10_14_0_2_um_filter_37_12]|uniref:Shikimate kinase n=1 Tax=Candidatus Magasanikbacteria bacterium CG_4_10_14_0_2_um_filter_37_12 TaxID=1974637 RepID=A0A2M7V6T7_9BACT|nr:MAG: hypothetical protein COX81_03685 [Candidatus Magasanikbacteria bacterium CG_4_10_14_0_2_um_filter_37_12]
MKHIILIGFKHVGKSVVGQALSEELNMPFLDIDRVIEDVYAKREGGMLSCRQIVEKHGLQYFRDLESEVLSRTLDQRTAHVIAPGGGVAMRLENQILLQNHVVVHVTADKNKVFERIMVSGRPAFFPKDEEPIVGFKRIWEERMPMYESLAHHTISNNTIVADSVREIVSVLELVQTL